MRQNFSVFFSFYLPFQLRNSLLCSIHTCRHTLLILTLKQNYAIMNKCLMRNAVLLVFMHQNNCLGMGRIQAGGQNRSCPKITPLKYCTHVQHVFCVLMKYYTVYINKCACIKLFVFVYMCIYFFVYMCINFFCYKTAVYENMLTISNTLKTLHTQMHTKTHIHTHTHT